MFRVVSIELRVVSLSLSLPFPSLSYNVRCAPVVWLCTQFVTSRRTCGASVRLLRFGSGGLVVREILLLLKGDG